MADYILDCNHLSEAIRPTTSLPNRIQASRRLGNRFVTTMPILCELQVGIHQTARPEENQRRLTNLLKHLRLWPLDLATTRVYAETYLELRRMGRALSQVDIVIATLARQHGLTILTTDKDFAALSDLRLENWVG